MKTLTKIEAVLTALAIVVVVSEVRVGAWLKSMSIADPGREDSWQRRLGPVGDILWYIAVFPWAIFTVIYLLVSFLHLSAWIFRKLTDEGRT